MASNIFYFNTYPSVYSALSSSAVVLWVDGGCSAACNDQWRRAEIKQCSKITQKQSARTWSAQMYISCHWSPHTRLGLQKLNNTHTRRLQYHIKRDSVFFYAPFLFTGKQSSEFRHNTYTQLHAIQRKFF